MNKTPLNFITKDKARYFRFLFEKGFRISRSSSFFESFGAWFLEFESPDCFIVILSDRDEVFVRIYPIKEDRNIVTDLQFMVYFLSDGRRFVGKSEGNLVWETNKQLHKMSALLEEYIDQIIPFMGSEYEKNKPDIASAEKQYAELQIATHKQSIKRKR